MPRSNSVRAIAAGLLAFVGLPLAASAQPAAGRTLVYAFESRAAQKSVGSDKNVEPAGEISDDDCSTGGFKISGTMPAQVAAGNGGIDWFQVNCQAGFGFQVRPGAQADRGTIRVSVVRAQPDGGLVVQLSEGVAAQPESPSATCVVFPTTELVCDPNKTISLEEATLLRFLAPDFAGPARDQSRWEYKDGSQQSSFNATYTLLRNNAGVMTIGEHRTTTGDAGPNSSAESRSTILYDTARAVPTAIHEDLVQKKVSYGTYGTAARDIVFRLESPNGSPR